MLSGTELVIILILALLLLGPQELPKVAKSLGKGMREFQKATNDLKSVVETEFAKMEQDINRAGESPTAAPTPGPIPADFPLARLAAVPPPEATLPANSTSPAAPPPAALPPAALPMASPAEASPAVAAATAPEPVAKPDPSA